MERANKISLIVVGAVLLVLWVWAVLGPDGLGRREVPEFGAGSFAGSVPTVGVVLPDYRPPRRGAPVGRVGGGTRSTEYRIPALQALAPPEVGLTARAQPVLYWFARMGGAVRFELAELSELGEQRVLSVRLPDLEPGLQKLDLADHDVFLREGVIYVWSVRQDVPGLGLALGSESSALIQRVPAPDLGDIPEGDLQSLGLAWASAGLWYDSLDAFSRAAERHPPAAGAAAQRRALLQQGGVGAWVLGSLRGSLTGATMPVAASR